MLNTLNRKHPKQKLFSRLQTDIRKSIKYRITSTLRRTFFSHFPEMKSRAYLKFRLLFFTLRKCRRHHCPLKKNGLAKMGRIYYMYYIHFK